MMEEINIDEWMTQHEPSRAGDARLNVEFYLHPCRNEYKSEQEGRSVFEDVEYVRIQVPGQRLTVIERPVRDEDKLRFAERYKRWKHGSKNEGAGTPLSEVTWLMPSTKEEYAFFKVVTIESLAECADTIPIPTLQGDKRRAKAYVAAMRENAPIVAIKKENAALSERLSALEQRVVMPAEDEGASPAADIEKRGPGRPPKKYG